MPAEFIPQNPNIANPPTLFLAVDFLAGWSSQTIEIDASGMAKEPSISDASLWKWLSYLMSSQASELESSFRWFGRTERHCLASGFDDYPRHRIISDKESHVDLLAWIVYALDVVDRHHLGVGDEPRSLLHRLRPYLLEKHWDASKHCFGDLGVIRQSEGKDEIGFETHVGYVSILPFALMLMDVDDPRIPEILDIIEDPNQVCVLLASHCVAVERVRTALPGKERRVLRSGRGLLERQRVGQYQLLGVARAPREVWKGGSCSGTVHACVFRASRESRAECDGAGETTLLL